ncbi:hypothetical protein HY256_03510, partial [Candidatus Sumerlaeota bacterium]|nr:hypothetical protein [Candidatus Sumerlaeota bacterium]
SAGAGYALLVVDDSACDMTPLTQADLAPAANVSPGQQYTFNITITPPAIVGPCNIQFRMGQSASQFGSTVSATPSIAALVNNSTGQGYSGPAKMKPGEALLVTFQFRNTGNAAWLTDGNYHLVMASNPCGFTLLPAQIVPLDITYPNTSNQFLAQVTAPGSPASCSFQVQVAEGATPFGGTITVNVEVANPPNVVRDWAVFE